MRRLIAILLAATLVFASCICMDDSDDTMVLSDLDTVKKVISDYFYSPKQRKY